MSNRNTNGLNGCLIQPGQNQYECTVAELAHAMRVSAKTAKLAARKGSLHSSITGPEIDGTLERLRDILGASSGSWDVSILDGLKSSWVDTLRALYAQPVAYPASLPPSQGMQIRNIVLNEKPAKVLEIGCFIGISSHWIASALHDLGRGKLDSVDTFLSKPPNRFHFSYLSDPYEVAVAARNASGFESFITFHRSDSVAFASKQGPNAKYDFIFIDGDHSFTGVLRDFSAWFPHLNVGGAILLHDTNPKHCSWTGPRRLIDELLSDNPQVAIDEIETRPNFGMAIVRKLVDTPNPFSGREKVRHLPEIVWRRGIDRLKGSSTGQTLIRHVAKPLIAYARRPERSMSMGE